MRLPRDVRGSELLAALQRLGCEAVRQRGSHVRITTQVNGEHHEVIPQYNPIKIKTLSNILKSIVQHHELTIAELLMLLDLRTPNTRPASAAPTPPASSPASPGAATYRRIGRCGG